MLRTWLEQHGHHCDTALLSEMPHAYEEVGRFISKYRPHVVIYEVGMPYSSSWDLLNVMRTSSALQSQPFIITTPDKRKLERAVGPTSAIQIGLRTDLHRVLRAIEAAVQGRAGSLRKPPTRPQSNEPTPGGAQ
jgi:hypothetical protein